MGSYRRQRHTRGCGRVRHVHWGIYGLLKEGASEDQIFAHLRDIETGRMELTDDAGVPLMPDVKRRAAVAALIALHSRFDKA